MSNPVLTCPDCGATESSTGIEHLAGCPAAKATDEMSDRDRSWFEAHPNATEYYRELMPGDLGVASLDAFVAGGKVHVTKQGPGIRARRLPAIDLKLDVLEGLSESAAYYLQFAARAAKMPDELAGKLRPHGEH